MTQLTANEIAAMKMCLNYNHRESQLADNHSNSNPADIGIALGWNKQQVGGLLSSLEQKGMAWVDDRSCEADPVLRNPDFHIVYLHDAGVNAIFDIMEGEVA